MRKTESLRLSFLNSVEKIKVEEANFWKLGTKDDNNPNTIWEESMVENSRQGEFEPEYFPEEKRLTFENYLIRRFHAELDKYRNNIDKSLLNIQQNPPVFVNLIELFRVDLEQLKEEYSGFFLNNFLNLKNFILSSLGDLIDGLNKLNFANINTNLEQDKIKFNLTKKEVCLLFNYLSRNNIIAGIHTNEELAELIEKHCMYKSSDNYHFITNAKNTLSKNLHDDAHKSLSSKLQKILKEYK